ncbi:CvpA family protein [Candidatus Bodocaedibacter vickermanii]|uniref:Colicin V production protein n=1 Tax=Candidatus Bodocaedibacter vickermanii TaxID=2741701 RepID=A0A7L9RU45_9PROT|nr:Colicin V production protein [Candidatus Paracaedibacteraceae bacterium 'Lake Konstanz']
MNTIDIIILILVLLSSIIGFWRGITREILGIFSWALAAVIAYFLYVLPVPLVGMVVSNEFLKEIISGLVVFLVALIVLTSITYSFSDAVKGSIIGGADKILGFLFGAIRGFLLISIIAVGAHKFLLKSGENAPTILKESKLIPITDAVMMRLIQSISADRLNLWKDKWKTFLAISL